MGKLIHDERFKTDQEQHDWIGRMAERMGVKRHVIIRWVFDDAMERQLEFNRKWNTGEMNGRPGMMRAIEGEREEKAS